MYRRLRVAALACTLHSPAYAQAPPAGSLEPAKAAAVDRAVLEEMSEQRVVGLAIGIIRDGEIVYLKGYGLADREEGVPATIETVFNWASNSKPVAAVAAMQLVEQGKLDLDADVRKYVPEFPDKGSVVTVRQLLCHQSGIPHYSNGEVVPTEKEYPGRMPFLDPVVALDTFNRSPLIFRPGERYEYSSYAYVLLSAVVQRAGGEGFVEQVMERIAGPLGMGSLQLDLEVTGKAGWAAGYARKRDRVVRAPEEAHYWKHGAGGFKSNVADFARWAEALIDHRLVSKATEAQMWAGQETAGGGATAYGLGFAVDEGPRGFRVSHNGSQDEARTRMVLYPGRGLGAVVMSNCDFAEVGRFTTLVLSASD